MADFLDENFGAETGPVDLNTLITPQPLPTIPEGSMKTRAATTALLSSDPAKSVENYQLMMQQAEGSDQTLLKQIQSSIVSETAKGDMKGIMSVLSDPTMPLDAKRAAISGVASSTLLKDTYTTLYSKGLEAPSKGETIEHEDSRLSSADAIRELYQSRQDIQGLVNAHAATLQNEDNLRTVGELASVWVLPFGNNASVGKVARGVDKAEGRKTTIWNTIKQFALAGSTTADLREQLASIPPEKRAEFAQTLISSIQANSGIIFSNDNHFAQYDKANTIFEEGGYSSTQEFLDNVAPLLDIVGIGQSIRGVSKAGKVAKAAGRAEAVLPDFGPAVPPTQARRAPAEVTGADLSSVTGRPTTGAFNERIAALEETRAGLLGDAETNLDKGGVAALKKEIADLPVGKNKYERAEINQRREALQTQLDQNAKASTVSQRIDELDKKIAELQKNNTEVFIQKTPLADAISRIETNVAKLENPASPGAIMGSSNPEKARGLHEAVFKSEVDEVAEGLFGVNRTQAIVNAVYPQVTTQSGKVVAKVADVERNLRRDLHVPEELIDTINNSGAIYYSPQEKAAARAHIVNDFSSAEGLTINDAMSSFTLDGGRIKIGAVYGNSDGSFLRAEDAVAQAKASLRHHGILDSEIEVLKRDGLDYSPVDLEAVRGVDGDYVVRVNTHHEIDPTDVGAFESLDVKRNWFDRIGGLVSNSKGSATRWLLDAASTLHPRITGAAVVASDATARFDKLMLALAGKFSDQYVKLDKAAKLKIDDYIREANFNGLRLDNADLIARGFNADEISTLTSWREFWDGHFYLENFDVVRSLNSQGYQLFENSNTRLYAKPIAKNQNIVKFYDPATDSIVVHGKAEGDALYNAGGTYAKLRRPATFGTDTVEHMIVRNTTNEYTRAFRDSDAVLNYREGYFQLQYKAPRFVDETIRDANGNVLYTKAIAVAGDTAEATRFADRTALSSGKARSDFTVRGDTRAMARDDDAYWDVTSASGRIAQRVRGKLLEDGAGLNHLGDASYIVNPVDSAVRAAKSISGRTVSRPMLEASKARYVQQYGEMLPSNGMGGVRWPKKVSEIGAKGQDYSSDVADARTAYEYINYLENGYANGMDDTFKMFFHSLGTHAGEFGLSRIERGAERLADVNVTSAAKKGVFLSYIAANPIRQWIVQTHQAIRTVAYNPMAWASGNMHRLPAEYLGNIAGLTKETEFAKFMKESGLVDAVDKNNLVRGSLMDAAETSHAAIRTLGKAASLPRRAGFDVGEQLNLISHAAAVFDRYKRMGKNVTDKAVKDEMVSETRAISYDMNFAGDMVYNQTTPAVVLQFMQVPHKAVLQITNRRLSRGVRARMVAADVLLWGSPAAIVASTIGQDILPDSPALREVFLWGAESYMLNNMFNVWVDEPGTKTSVDFSSLAPYDLTGWGKFYHAMYEDGLSGVVMNSPAGQLYLKEGGRSRSALTALGRYFNIVEDDQEIPETFISVMNEVAKMSSGWNNGIKARIMLNTGKKVDQYGATIDKSTTPVEGWAQALGFGTSDARDYYRASMALSADVKAHREATLEAYKDIKRYYAEKLESDDVDPKFVTKVTGWALKSFEKDPVAMKIIAGEWAKDMQGKDNALLALFLRRSNIPTLGGLRDEVRNMPVSEDDKAKMMQRIDDMERLRSIKE